MGRYYIIAMVVRYYSKSTNNMGHDSRLWGGREMKVINVDKKGNIIKDMRKVVLPEEKQKQLIQIYYKGERHEKEIRNKAITMQ